MNKEFKMPEDTYLLYCNEEHMPRKFTIAACIDRQTDTISFGVAVVSSKERSFKKRIGRDIAIGRATSKPIKTIAYDSSKKIYDYLTDMANEIDATLEKHNVDQILKKEN